MSTLRDRLTQLQSSVDVACPATAVPYTRHNFDFYQKFDNISALVSKTIHTLVVGRDFYNESGLSSNKVAPTDARIDKIRCAAGYDLSKVGFVNVWPVLRAGEYPVCGDHPTSGDRHFTMICKRRIKEIIRLLDVDIVITLGKAPARFVSEVVGGEDLFAANAPTINGGRAYVAISHPSFPNHIGREKQLGRSEVSMLQQALVLTRSRMERG